MELREFFIENWLEQNRLQTSCNLGESGFRNYFLKDLFHNLSIDLEEFFKISLADSSNLGDLRLRKKIAELYPDTSFENILVTTGTSEALFILFNLLIKKDTRVRLFFPSFQALYEIPKSLGAKLEFVSIQKELNLDKLFKDQPDLIILNHPHNPTGFHLDKDKILELETLLKNFKGKIIFDEHYRFLDFDSELGYTGYKNKTNYFATGSITKCFGVTGLRIGWLVAEKNLIQKARAFKDYLTHTVNPISEYLAFRILEKRNLLIKPIKESILSNIKYFSENYKKIPSLVDFKAPEAGLVSFIKLKNGIESKKYVENLIQNSDVFILPGSDFEMEGYIRIGFGESNQRFKDGIQRWIQNEI